MWCYLTLKSTHLSLVPRGGTFHVHSGACLSDCGCLRVRRHFNTLALAGVTFGLISTKYQALGVLPILGIVFSTLGLVTFDARTEKCAGWRASGSR